MTLPEWPAAARTWSHPRSRKTLLDEFEQVYLRNVDVLMGYFARRCGDPHTVADLTSETFVRAMDGFARFDPRRGSDRAWLFGIASHVFARHCDQSAGGRSGGRVQIAPLRLSCENQPATRRCRSGDSARVLLERLGHSV
jgi:DNA-directed RNA polymerase specialized sigma24 family protein